MQATPKRRSSLLSSAGLTTICLFLMPATYASTLPFSSVLAPSRVEQALNKPMQRQNVVSENVRVKNVAASLIPNAKKLKFHLQRIIITGNHVFTSQELMTHFHQKIGSTISVADIEQYTNTITKLYGDSGYILSKAIIPAQVIKHGIIRIQVIEGYVADIHIKINNPVALRVRPLLWQLAKNIAHAHPLTNKILERYTLLANDIPGLQVRTILKASKQTPQAASLTFIVDRKLTYLNATWDNRGTQAIGSRRYMLDITRTSLISAAGETGVRYVMSEDGQELNFWELYHQQFLNSEGLRLRWAFSATSTKPDDTINPIRIIGRSTWATLAVDYPVVRARSKNLMLESSLSAISSRVQVAASPLYNDRSRVLGLGFDYTWRDTYAGSNNLHIMFNQGLDALGASAQGSNESRADGHTIFYKLNATAYRIQSLTQHNALELSVDSQYSFNPLLVSQEFGFGGGNYGRAYDSSEIIGDNGVALNYEWIYSRAPGWPLLHRFQLFSFYEIGKVWNYDSPNQVSFESASDVGGGVKLKFNNAISLLLVWAKPLNRNVASRVSDKPRGFFSVLVHL